MLKLKNIGQKALFGLANELKLKSGYSKSIVYNPIFKFSSTGDIAQQFKEYKVSFQCQDKEYLDETKDSVKFNSSDHVMFVSLFYPMNATVSDPQRGEKLRGTFRKFKENFVKLREEKGIKAKLHIILCEDPEAMGNTIKTLRPELKKYPANEQKQAIQKEIESNVESWKEEAYQYINEFELNDNVEIVRWSEESHTDFYKSCKDRVEQEQEQFTPLIFETADEFIKRINTNRNIDNVSDDDVTGSREYVKGKATLLFSQLIRYPGGFFLTPGGDTPCERGIRQFYNNKVRLSFVQPGIGYAPRFKAKLQVNEDEVSNNLIKA